MSKKKVTSEAPAAAAPLAPEVAPQTPAAAIATPVAATDAPNPAGAAATLRRRLVAEGVLVNVMRSRLRVF